MNPDANATLILSLGLAILMLTTGLAGRKETLPLDSFFGIRTKATRVSEATWQAAHVAASPFNFVAAACFAITGLVAAFLVDGQQAASSTLVVGWGLGMLATGGGVFVARRAAERVADNGDGEH